jgi:hypothetical protein
MTSEKQFRISPQERRLLRSLLNEVVNGFDIPDFESKIGMEREDTRALLGHIRLLNDTESPTLTPAQVQVFRNSLFETIRELGVEEFQTRTGFDLHYGHQILEKLDLLLD